MKGVVLASHYGFPPNSENYCGEPSFLNALKKGDEKELKKEIRKFRAHHAYLRLIAKANNLDTFDPEVVRAFWVGNNLLNNVSLSSTKELICDLLHHQPERAKQLCAKLPDEMTPHHSFHVLYVNFITNKVSRSIENYDLCCVTGAKVLSCSDNSLHVRRFSIEEGLSLGYLEEDILMEKKGIRFIEDVCEGDFVSVHWGMAIETLSSCEYRNLRKYTEKNIKALA